MSELTVDLPVTDPSQSDHGERMEVGDNAGNTDHAKTNDKNAHPHSKMRRFLSHTVVITPLPGGGVCLA